MTLSKKQLKITKLFRKGATKTPQDSDELHEEIKDLEKNLQEKENELFQIQRNLYRCKVSPPKRKSEIFVRPQKIVLTNSVEILKRNLELMTMLSGVEVTSYVADDHCCIVYHLQHDSQNEVKHGLRIELKDGINHISKSSMPLGFNFNAVLEDFDNIMKPECLRAVRKALVAYYDRLEQFEFLKKLVSIEVQLFKIMDGSHIEISFSVQSEMDDQEEITPVVLCLDYRVYGIRPKVYSFKEHDLPEGMSDVLRQQCLGFKRKSLDVAFREAFMDGIGPFKLVKQVGFSTEGQEPKRKKRYRQQPHNYNNDDTFRPEECSEISEDDMN